jgi:hypothetical protein
MANRQRAEARRKAQAKASRSSGEGEGGSKLAIWIGLAAVIALVIGIIAWARRCLIASQSRLPVTRW